MSQPFRKVSGSESGDQMNALQSQLARFEAELGSARREQARLADQLEQAQATIEHSQAELAAARQNTERLAAERDAQVAVEQLTADLEAARAQTQALQTQLAASPTSAELQGWQEQAARVTAERETTRAKVAQLANDLAVARQQLNQWEEQAVQLHQSETELTRKLAEQAAEIERLRTRPVAEAPAVPASVVEESPQPAIQESPVERTVYCLTCRTYRPISDAREVIMPDGRRVVRSRCTVCGVSILGVMDG